MNPREGTTIYQFEKVTQREDMIKITNHATQASSNQAQEEEIDEMIIFTDFGFKKRRTREESSNQKLVDDDNVQLYVMQTKNRHEDVIA